MSLFEINIHKDFQILNTNVFLNKEEFEKYYKLNNLNDGDKDDISKYLLDELSLKVYHNLFVMSNFTYDVEEVLNIIKSNLYLLNKESKEEILYPEWMLFFIAIIKHKVSFIDEKKIREYLKFFKYIAEIRYKRYIIRNVDNFIHNKYYGKSDNIKNDLYTELSEYLINSKYTTNKLFSFLNFLYFFHLQLKENEKYKLMWNLETYIIETIRLLLDNDISMTKIYLKTYENMRGDYSVLHDIHIYKPLYIKESKNDFQLNLFKINNIFKIEITLDAFMNTLTSNEKYNDILFSYLELLNRFNANKRSEDVMSAMIKGIILGVEEYIKYDIKEDTFDRCLEKLSNDKGLFQDIRIKQKEYNDGNELLNLINNLTEKEENLEKYLAIYYSARNYLAHYNMNMDKFFWGNDGKRLIISNVIDSVLIILYKIEMNK